MNILVCITCVPDTTSKIAFVDNNTKFDQSGVQYILGPYDNNALSRAVELKEASGGKIKVLHVGGPENDPVIRKALAIGADEAIRVNAQPKDAYFVAKQIAHIAQQDQYDMILMGRESIDYNGGQVHGMVGELLGMPSISPAMLLEVEGNQAKIAREIEGGKEWLSVEFPFVAGCQEPIAEWRTPNMRGIMAAKSKPFQVVDPVDVSEKINSVSFELPAQKAGCKLVDADQVDELVRLLKEDAKVL